MTKYHLIRSTCVKEYERLKHLFQAHWEEIGMVGTKDLTCNIDLSYYELLEKLNRHYAIGIETETNTLVGYVSMTVSPHPHHMGKRFAMTDAIYLLPEHRTMAGVRAFYNAYAVAEDIAIKEYGVDFIQFLYSLKNDLSKMGKFFGYSHSDAVMVREVK